MAPRSANPLGRLERQSFSALRLCPWSEMGQRRTDARGRTLSPLLLTKRPSRRADRKSALGHMQTLP
jgi:hypothetical protein